MLDQHHKKLHEQFSQILSTIRKSKTPKLEAPTFAITTRLGVSTKDPPFPAPSQLTSANHTEGATKKEGPEDAGPSIIQEPAPRPSIFYQPSKSSNLPFSSRLKKQKKDDEDVRLLSIFKQIHINLPFLEAMIHMPKGAKVLKDLLSHKEKLEKAASSVKLSEECSAIIQRSLPQKERDLGSFTLPCLIGPLAVKNALADLGASINLMPHSLFRRLGISKLKPTKISIQLAYRSIKYPIRVCENLLVKSSKFIFLVDFVVLEIEEYELVPIILRRPFLTTTRAIIDVHKGKFSLRVGTDRATRMEGPENNQLPVVISSALSIAEKARLLEVLKNHKGAIAWSIADIKGINFSFCTYKILIEDEFKPCVQTQRRVNLNIKEVVKKEVIKLLDVRLIYPIFDSPWVSPIQVVPKKGGITVVKNEKDELIPQRTVTGCDYAVGAVLGQRIDKHFKPIHYASKMINEAQENYTTTKKKLLAIIFAFNKFRQYLVLSKTVVFTDHSAVRYLFTKQDAKLRLIRWILLLQELDIEIRDKKGVKNLAADHLSRLENPDLGKLTKAKIRDLFLEEYVLTESYEGAWPENRRHKSFDSVTADLLEDIMASPLLRERSSKPDSIGHIYSAMHINELDEMRLNAYELSISYKERTKRWHDKRIKATTNYERGDKVLLFNSHLMLFPRKLKSRWYGPFSVCKDMKNGVIELYDEDGNEFTINKQRVKPYQKSVLDTNRDDDITLDDEGEVT
ncbi:reverse transcriptase domain-containing protein [Tanacetum coccineum]